MRYLPTGRLTPGMALGQDIFDGAGRLLLAKHLLLSEEYISNLEFLGFPGVYIDDEFTRGVEIQQIISPQVRSRALKIVYELFGGAGDGQESGTAEVRIQKVAESVVENVVNNGDVMYNMLDIKNYDDYIYYHSISVGVLSIVTGARLGLAYDELCQLACAAFLHDIGKRFMDRETVGGWETRGGAEEEVFKSHPKLGAEYLRSVFHFSHEVYTGILEHHESYNGEGYPLGKTGEDIGLFARIIRIANCYDVMTSAQPAGKGQPPSEALEYLMAMSGVRFDPQLVNIFVRKMAAYPVGCEVELSNGHRAVVMENFDNFPLRPLVRVIDTGEILNLRDEESARAITVGRLIMQ